MSDTLSRLDESKLAFRSALCDSFNTPEALKILRDLVSRTNVYMNSCGKNLNVGMIERSAQWVGDMLRMFGLGEGEKLELGWGQETTNDGNAVNVSLPTFNVPLPKSCRSAGGNFIAVSRRSLFFQGWDSTVGYLQSR